MLRIESPNGNMLETAIARLRRYITEHSDQMRAQYHADGHSWTRADELTREWANNVVRGSLSNLAKSCYVADAR